MTATQRTYSALSLACSEPTSLTSSIVILPSKGCPQAGWRRLLCLRPFAF